MALSEKLDELRAGMARLPDDIRETMLAAQAELISSGIAEQALGVGDTVPDFDLPNQRGETVSLTQMLSGGPVVISFYRGGWCPYCNLELRALQEKLPEITDLGARLLAVTPELPDNAMSTAEKNAVRFDILSDVGNRIASAFGLVFHLPASLRPVYEGFGLDLVKANGDDSYTLPIPATYVVDTDRKILAAHVDMDYSQRMEPEAVIAALAAKAKAAS